MTNSAEHLGQKTIEQPDAELIKSLREYGLDPNVAALWMRDIPKRSMHALLDGGIVKNYLTIADFPYALLPRMITKAGSNNRDLLSYLRSLRDDERRDLLAHRPYEITFSACAAVRGKLNAALARMPLATSLKWFNTLVVVTHVGTEFKMHCIHIARYSALLKKTPRYPQGGYDEEYRLDGKRIAFVAPLFGLEAEANIVLETFAKESGASDKVSKASLAKKIPETSRFYLNDAPNAGCIDRMKIMVAAAAYLSANRSTKRLDELTGKLMEDKTLPSWPRDDIEAVLAGVLRFSHDGSLFSYGDSFTGRSLGTCALDQTRYEVFHKTVKDAFGGSPPDDWHDVAYPNRGESVPNANGKLKEILSKMKEWTQPLYLSDTLLVAIKDAHQASGISYHWVGGNHFNPFALEHEVVWVARLIELDLRDFLEDALNLKGGNALIDINKCLATKASLREASLWLKKAIPETLRLHSGEWEKCPEIAFPQVGVSQTMVEAMVAYNFIHQQVVIDGVSTKVWNHMLTDAALQQVLIQSLKQSSALARSFTLTTLFASPDSIAYSGYAKDKIPKKPASGWVQMACQSLHADRGHQLLVAIIEACPEKFAKAQKKSSADNPKDKAKDKPKDWKEKAIVPPLLTSELLYDPQGSSDDYDGQVAFNGLCMSETGQAFLLALFEGRPDLFDAMPTGIFYRNGGNEALKKLCKKSEGHKLLAKLQERKDADALILDPFAKMSESDDMRLVWLLAMSDLGKQFLKVVQDAGKPIGHFKGSPVTLEQLYEMKPEDVAVNLAAFYAQEMQDTSCVDGKKNSTVAEKLAGLMIKLVNTHPAVRQCLFDRLNSKIEKKAVKLVKDRQAGGTFAEALEKTDLGKHLLFKLREESKSVSGESSSGSVVTLYSSRIRRCSGNSLGGYGSGNDASPPVFQQAV